MEAVSKEFFKQGMDFQSEVVVMARKKLQDADDVAYQTKMTHNMLP